MSLLRARIAELVSEFGLPDGAARRIRGLLDLVETDPSAPTSVTEAVAAVEVHVADSLDGLRVAEVRAAERIADLGAGAGFPGLVLALALPAARVALLESVGKKVAFMQRAALAAGLGNATPLHVRAEEWTEGFGQQQIVTARALAPLTTLVEYAAPLLESGGRLVAWKGACSAAEEADGQAAAAATGLELADVVRLAPRTGAEHRRLYLYVKSRPTPPAYPRRAGMARKRPITAPV